MKIEKMPEGYLLARKGGNGCELWRKFNGAESMACDAIDELIAERDELRAKIAESMACDAIDELIAERDALRAKIEQMEKRLRLILEEPENTMSNSKALREMVRQARLALEESK